jgi:hypothetical protein
VVDAVAQTSRSAAFKTESWLLVNERFVFVYSGERVQIYTVHSTSMDHDDQHLNVQHRNDVEAFGSRCWNNLC